MLAFWIVDWPLGLWTCALGSLKMTHTALRSFSSCFIKQVGFISMWKVPVFQKLLAWRTDFPLFGFCFVFCSMHLFNSSFPYYIKVFLVLLIIIFDFFHFLRLHCLFPVLYEMNKLFLNSNRNPVLLPVLKMYYFTDPLQGEIKKNKTNMEI